MLWDMSGDKGNFPNYFHMDSKALLKSKINRKRRLRRCSESVPVKFSLSEANRTAAVYQNRSGLNKPFPKSVSYYNCVSHMAVNFCNFLLMLFSLPSAEKENREAYINKNKKMKSHRVFAQVAQMVVHCISNTKVMGLIPRAHTCHKKIQIECSRFG